MGDKGISIYDVEEIIRKFAQEMRISEEATRELKKEMEEDAEELLEKAKIIAKHRKGKGRTQLKKEDIFLASI
ncbi:MAG: histone-like protein [Candidatus Micrarchaeia archaeon]|jgi:histone H3/H4